MNLSNILVETGLCQIEPKLQIVKSDDYIVKTKALCHGIAHDTENSLNSLKNTQLIFVISPGTSRKAIDTETLKNVSYLS